MTDRELVDKVNTVLAEEFDLNSSHLHPGASFVEDLGLDRQEMAEAAGALERALGVRMSKDAAFARIRTVGDLHAYVLAKKKGRGGCSKK